MKKLFLSAIAFIVVLICLAACKKSKSVTIPAGMSATIDGSSWNATKFYFEIDTSSSGKITFHVFGGDTVWGPNAKAIGFWTGDFIINKSTYTFDASSPNGAEYNDRSINGYFHANSGSFQLISLSPDTAIGTFSFTTHKHSVQNGLFKVPRYH